MTLDDLKDHFTNGYQFERITGISAQNWHNWFMKYGYVPINSQLKIQQKTGGTLKASLDHLKKT